MNLSLYQIDAFTSKLFSGNPAAVCPLEKWLPDELMQNIAMENNLAETAFYVKEGEDYAIRWFTPVTEVDLCGHATLAAAFVLFNYESEGRNKIIFNSRSGQLSVTRNNFLLVLDFPADTLEEISLNASHRELFDQNPVRAFHGRTDLMLVFETEAQIKTLVPNLEMIKKLDVRGVIATSKGSGSDFVSRFFAPQCGIDEDPVTGSAHTSLTPFWAKELKKTDLTALQLSPRGGTLNCSLRGDRVEISGEGRTFLKGTIFTGSGDEIH